MMRHLFLIAVVLLAAADSAHALFPPSNAWPPIWPLPANYSSGNATIAFDVQRLKLIYNGGQAPTQDMQGAFTRFMDRAFSSHVSQPTNLPPNIPLIKAIFVNVVNAIVPLQFGVDEKYKLEISSKAGITINANTIYGAYHGLETASQLIGFCFATQSFQTRFAPWIINDAPRFAHRGMLMDTARHYLPLRTIFTYIDSLTYAKINTLHWHIVDSQSFPFVAPSNPKLAEMGSWSQSERFTAADVAAVVEYGRKRGVRVMIEVDTPGHSASWCRGAPEICPTPFCPGFSGNVNNPALDFTKNITYETVQNVIADLTKLAPDNFFHLGGDEVDTNCWSQRPAIMRWLSERGMTLNQGFEYYLKRVIKYVSGVLGKTIVVWNDSWTSLGPVLPKSTVYEVWKTSDVVQLIENITSHGYRVIANPSSVWYLDHLSVTWDVLYTYDPCAGLSAAACSQVVGTETDMWGETVDTSDAMMTVWPRALAFAERSWSPKATTQSVSDALPRILAMRCLLHERGINAAPVNNLQARSAPTNPGSCFWQ